MIFLAVACLSGMKEFSRAAGETDKNQNIEGQTETYATGLYIEETAGGGILGNIAAISAENGISFYSIDGQAEVTALYYDQLDATSKRSLCGIVSSLSGRTGYVKNSIAADKYLEKSVDNNYR